MDYIELSKLAQGVWYLTYATYGTLCPTSLQAVSGESFGEMASVGNDARSKTRRSRREEELQSMEGDPAEVESDDRGDRNSHGVETPTKLGAQHL